jgi:uncharacterized protein with ParB-like and HNH nuclease domain/predicted RNA-binding protein with TRAM domain
MSTTPEIKSSVLTLEEIYEKNNYYSVPDFQREYVWKRENVEQLLEDIYAEFYDENGNIIKDSSEYFIGSIVVYPDSNKTYQIIDGQQRLITCYLILCAVRDSLMKIDINQVPPVLREMIRSSYFDENGESTPRNHLVLQYKDSREVLESIATEKIPKIDKNSTDSVKNILAAYQIINETLKEFFDNKPGSINKFLASFIKRVKLIQIITPNASHALSIFETINNRGIDLDAMDLLKNMLFGEVSDKEYSILKQKWKELTKILEKCNEKPLRFLRYYILSHHKVDTNKLKEDLVYDWFEKNSAGCGIKQNPIAFVDSLINQGNIYKNFVELKDVEGNPNPNLYNISCLSRTVRQHFILLMAGQHLQPDLFKKLCFNIENLLFCSVFTHVKANVFESNFSRWAMKLRTVRDDNDLDVFLNDHFKEDIMKRSVGFDNEFKELSDSSVLKYRLNYILAKLSQFVDENSLAIQIGLDQYLEKSNIEYILPNTNIPNVISVFDKPSEYETYMKKLGNLVLIENSINTSSSKDVYVTKKHGYRNSSYLLNKSLVEKPQNISNTKLNPVIKEILESQFETWDSIAILKRQKLLGQLARQVWLSILENKEKLLPPKGKMICPIHNNISIAYLQVENKIPVLLCDCGAKIELKCDKFVFDTNILVSQLFSDLSNSDFFKGKTILIPETVIDEFLNWKKYDDKKWLFIKANEEVKKMRITKEVSVKKIGKDASYSELIEKGRADKIISKDAEKQNAIVITIDKDFYSVNPDVDVIIYRYYPTESEITEIDIVGESQGDGVGYYKNHTVFVVNAGDKIGHKVNVKIETVNSTKKHAKARIIASK